MKQSLDLKLEKHLNRVKNVKERFVRCVEEAVDGPTVGSSDRCGYKKFSF